MANYFVRKRSYGPNNPHQREHEDIPLMMVVHDYTPISLVEGGAFRRMVTRLDPSIGPLTRSKLTRVLIPHQIQKAETEVSVLLDGVRCIVISYDLWIPKTTQDFFNDGSFHMLSCQRLFSYLYAYHNIHRW